MDYVDPRTHRARTYYGRVVVEYLSDAVMTTDQAVVHFVDPIRDSYLNAENPESIEIMLWAAWEAVIKAALDHPDAQDQLVALLVAIAEQGPLIRASDGQVCVIWGDLTVFSDLPVFGAAMREQINTGTTEPAGDDALLDANFVSFAARLTAARIDFSLYAVWTFRECVGRTPVDFTAFRIWHRLGGSELVRGLTELAAPQPPPQPPPAVRAPETREALRAAVEAWKARQEAQEAPEGQEPPEALRESWAAWEAQQAARHAAREAPEAREALRLIEKLNRERRDG